MRSPYEGNSVGLLFAFFLSAAFSTWSRISNLSRSQDFSNLSEPANPAEGVGQCKPRLALLGGADEGVRPYIQNQREL